MWTRESLIEHMAKGAEVDFLFFWGHKPKHEGHIDKACLSQWFPCPFKIDGATYATAEHFMMAEKARLFGDEEALAQILIAPTPAKAKELGRGVRNFEGDKWEAARGEAVVRGNVAKFSSDERLKSFLVKTGDRILVEASPRDKIWGIGMGSGNPDAGNPAKWRGRNLLGFALVEARARIRGA